MISIILNQPIYRITLFSCHIFAMLLLELKQAQLGVSSFRGIEIHNGGRNSDRRWQHNTGAKEIELKETSIIS